jgi:hypothetical protein
MIDWSKLKTAEAKGVEASTAVLAQLTAAIQRHLDESARQRDYDGILSLCSYVTSTVPHLQAEGLAGVVLRDACWLLGGQIRTEVQGGLRPVPTEAELIALMPAVGWPV